jgi:hypothetical protein
LATCPVTRFNHNEVTMHATSIVNGVDLGRLSETIDTVTADPALAQGQFRARSMSARLASVLRL